MFLLFHMKDQERFQLCMNCKSAKSLQCSTLWILHMNTCISLLSRKLHGYWKWIKIFTVILSTIPGVFVQSIANSIRLANQKQFIIPYLSVQKPRGLFPFWHSIHIRSFCILHLCTYVLTLKCWTPVLMHAWVFIRALLLFG